MIPGQLPLARFGDPETSHAAARELTSAFTMRVRCLRALNRLHWGTSEDIQREAGYTAADGAWKRVSDLKNLGLVRPTGEVRKASTGRLQDVLEVTDAGRDLLRRTV